MDLSGGLDASCYATVIFGQIFFPSQRAFLPQFDNVAPSDHVLIGPHNPDSIRSKEIHCEAPYRRNCSEIGYDRSP